jgi:hypothetical protein
VRQDGDASTSSSWGLVTEEFVNAAALSQKAPTGVEPYGLANIQGRKARDWSIEDTSLATQPHASGYYSH